MNMIGKCHWKCHICEYDVGPLVNKPDICRACRNANKFQAKKRMNPKQAHEYETIKKEEEWINDKSIKFDRDTALAVLKAISTNMHPSHDLFGEPTLVINRYRFEAVRKKFLDV